MNTIILWVLVIVLKNGFILPPEIFNSPGDCAKRASEIQHPEGKTQLKCFAVATSYYYFK